MRQPLDFYETPPWQTRALLDNYWIAGRVLEPCAGDGSLARVLRESPQIGAAVVTNDIDFKRLTDFHEDATLERAWDKCPKNLDWVITNPPFNGAFSILKHAYSHVGRVALLLRLSFLEPTKARGLWLSQNPPDKLIVLPRWSYSQNGKSDSVTTAWMVWDAFERCAKPIVIHPEKPRNEKASRRRINRDGCDGGLISFDGSISSGSAAPLGTTESGCGGDGRDCEAESGSIATRYSALP